MRLLYDSNRLFELEEKQNKRKAYRDHIRCRLCQIHAHGLIFHQMRQQINKRQQQHKLRIIATMIEAPALPIEINVIWHAICAPKIPMAAQ